MQWIKTGETSAQRLGEQSDPRYCSLSPYDRELSSLFYDLLPDSWCSPESYLYPLYFTLFYFIFASPCNLQDLSSPTRDPWQ